MDTNSKSGSGLPKFITKDGEAVEIPVQGCLGLLAYGDIGLMSWRQKKLETIREHLEKQNDIKTDNKS